ncbi:hypothetical protein N7G274_010615 [Stereocaulon virgatum]|uniref:Uncharacterized protein n=1 Tax=Stereocaulon virgatum TaxID=373712 RepID=A0ABR3ZT90_9LECA
MMLPMIIEWLTINSCADSGSEDSIFGKDLVMQLHLEIDSPLEHQKKFWNTKGNPVKVPGRSLLMILLREIHRRIRALYATCSNSVQSTYERHNPPQLTKTIPRYRY